MGVHWHQLSIMVQLRQKNEKGVDVMEEKQGKCENCGKTITEMQQKNHEYKYCSYSCYYDGRYGKIVSSKKMKTRNPLYLETVKLIKAGITQKEATERMGININGFKDWLYKKNDLILNEGICGYCGKSLEGIAKNMNRKYCTGSCRAKAKYRERHPESKTRTKYAPGLLEEALELYWNGLGGRAIGLHLDIPEGTVHSWIHDYGGEKERCEPFTPVHLKPFRRRLMESKTAKEWLETLHLKAALNSENVDGKPVRLFCETVTGQKNAPGMLALIVECMKADPFSGEVFAFCNKTQRVINTITWEKGMFITTGYHKIKGSFLWPHEDLGQSVEVCAQTFEYMISFCKINRKIIENA